MFYMTSCFSLADGYGIEEATARLSQFARECRAQALVVGENGPGRRVRHPIMDTDPRGFDFVFQLSFADRAQCDAAVQRFSSNDYAEKDAHESLFSMLSDPVFFCWEVTESRSGN